MSAYTAHTRAMAKARASTDSSYTVECPACKGTGKITIVTQVGMFDDLFGSLPAAHTERTGPTQIPCVNCKHGKVNPVQLAYQKHIWCSCPSVAKGGKPVHASYAPDGVKVFGKPVLLCDRCGCVHSM